MYNKCFREAESITRQFRDRMHVESSSDVAGGVLGLLGRPGTVLLAQAHPVHFLGLKIQKKCVKIKSGLFLKALLRLKYQKKDFI